MVALVGASLFSNIGIGEFYTESPGSTLKIAIANELLEDRATFYGRLHPDTRMIRGDITEDATFNRVISEAIKSGVNVVMATPPCQGMSIAGTSGRAHKDDPRNYLIKSVVRAIQIIKPRFAVIENVAGLGNTEIDNCGQPINMIDYITEQLSPLQYFTTVNRVNAADYGTPQHRKRMFVLIRRGGIWAMPKPTVSKHRTVKEAIAHLPSVEAGQAGPLPWHAVGRISQRHRAMMRHTPPGKSAYDNNNPAFRPIMLDRMSGKMREIIAFPNAYKRIQWDEPAPTITMSSGSISSQNNVHPGRPLPDGNWSDARPLTIREISVLSGLPENWLDQYPAVDPIFNEKFFRQVIGECVSPDVIKAIFNSLQGS